MSEPMIVVLGAAGMLGHKMFQILRGEFSGTLATIREDPEKAPLGSVDLLKGRSVYSAVDATDFPGLRNLLSRLEPTYVVNCIGIIKQRPEARAAVPSITLNALLPHLLCEWAQGWGGRLIHFSTDCVFDGKIGRYTENDRTNADDLYGRTKALGEVTDSNALTLRTSIIGRELSEHQSLLDWILAQKGKTVRGFSRVIYSGVTTNYLARVVVEIIRNHPRLSGLYQVASNPITKHDLLVLINEAYDLGLTVLNDATEVSDRSLVGERFVKTTGIVTPSWPELVRELRTDPTPYQGWIGR